MIVLVNGPFGVGKSTVAAELVKLLPGSILYDPELLGEPADALTKAFRPAEEGSDDFQDIKLWPALLVDTARRLRELYAPTLVVPMSFDDPERLTKIRKELSSFDRETRHFCLTAPLPLILQRLKDRGESNGEWVVRRARECCERQRGAEYERFVDASKVPAIELAQQIAAELRLGA